jgi:integrase/recombinase XerD
MESVKQKKFARGDMGQCGLGSSERHLKLTPERFRKELVKLSPQRPKKRRWRDDSALMKFLAEL